MPYTFQSRLRYSECGEDGLQSVFSIMNYLQDCSTFQSESLGLGVARMKEAGKAWLLSAWHVVIDRYPAFGETIEIGTFASGFQGFYGFRKFFIRDAAASFCVRADSIWFFYDTARGVPERPQSCFSGPYVEAEQETNLDMLQLGPMQRKLLPPERGAGRQAEPVTVVRHFLDSNNHMNNARYLDLASEAADVWRPRELWASYSHEAVLHDVLTPVVETNARGKLVGLFLPDGRTSAVVAFKEAVPQEAEG